MGVLVGEKVGVSGWIRRCGSVVYWCACVRERMYSQKNTENDIMRKSEGLFGSAGYFELSLGFAHSTTKSKGFHKIQRSRTSPNINKDMCDTKCDKMY